MLQNKQLIRLMKKALMTIALGLVLSQSAIAVDIQRGKDLHQENCIQCHASMLGGDGSSIYTRPERRIDSLPALDHQVRRCKNSLGLPWPEDQIEDLIAYLNQAFYHFKEE